MNKRKYISLALGLVISSFSFSQSLEGGSLLIMGGEATNTYFLNCFAGLAGGLDKKIVVIPTAMDESLLDSEKEINLLLAPFAEIGFTNVTIAHTRNRDEANSEAFNKLIREANGVWITGGRQWRLAQVYVGTEVENALKKMVNNGGVLAGTSAGASILASFLVRGDSLSSAQMIGGFQKGFGFVERCAIDQHYLARNRMFDMFEVLEQYPELLGFGIEENTGIIVRDNRFRVIGESYVGVYDGTRWSEERDTVYQLADGVQQFYLLAKDLEYDLAKRKVVFPKDRKPGIASNKFLAELVGTYQQQEGLTYLLDLQITVSFENGNLYFTNSWNSNKYQVLYDHANVFYRPNANAVYFFDRNKEGNIVQFKFYQFGSTTWVKKDGLPK